MNSVKRTRGQPETQFDVGTKSHIISVLFMGLVDDESYRRSVMVGIEEEAVVRRRWMYGLSVQCSVLVLPISVEISPVLLSS